MTQLPKSALEAVQTPVEFWVTPGETAAELRRRYGDVVRLEGRDGLPFVCASGADALKTLLVDQASKLTNLRGWQRISPAVAPIGRGIIFMDGDERQWFRRVMTPAFAPAAVAAHAPLIHEIAKRRIAAWPRDGVVGLYGEISRMTFEVSVSVMLGVRDTTKIDELYRLFSQVTLETGVKPSALSVRPKLATALTPILRTRAANPGDDMLSRIIKAGGPGGERLSEEQILTHANMMVIVGYYTSSPLCSYMLVKASEHPAFMERLHEEQDSIEAEDYDAVSKMELLDRTLLEMERWGPSLPHLPRRVEEDIDLMGQTCGQANSSCARLPARIGTRKRFPIRTASTPNVFPGRVPRKPAIRSRAHLMAPVHASVWERCSRAL